jgi:hypothetical protein
MLGLCVRAVLGALSVSVGVLTSLALESSLVCRWKTLEKRFFGVLEVASSTSMLDHLSTPVKLPRLPRQLILVSRINSST